MRTRALVLLFACLAFTSCGQDYVITSKLDTLRGGITINSYKAMDKVQVAESRKNKQELGATSVVMVMKDGETYRTLTAPDGYRLMKLSRRGYLSLYLGRQASGTPYEVPYLVKDTGESMEVPTMLFKKRMMDFLDDCAQIKEEIEGGKLGRKNLNQIIDGYNLCMDMQTKKAYIAESDLAAVTRFRTKLEQDKSISVDVMEILTDLFEKVKDQKPVPSYMKGALREALKNYPAFHPDLDELLAKLND